MEFFSLPFRFISLRSENYGSFSLPFRFISLRSENDGSFLLLFHFVFASFHFRFASNFYVSHKCETCEKSFRFASFRFEVKMTAHPNRQLFLYCLGTYTFFQFKGLPSFKVDKTGFSI
jgi:hypothetical protein